jgi:hypothetical protein
MSTRKKLTEKEASKKKIGSFYHPTKSTFRTGSCPKGMEIRIAYVKKNGTKVNEKCIKNRGLPGKTLESAKVIKLTNKNSLKNYSTKNSLNERLKSLKKSVKDLSYKTVILRLSALRTLTKRTNPRVSSIYNEDMKKLKEWKISKKNK